MSLLLNKASHTFADCNGTALSQSNIICRFVELHGDRAGLDDPAMVCGLASMDGVSFMFIGHQKGRNTKVPSLSPLLLAGICTPRGVGCSMLPALLVLGFNCKIGLRINIVAHVLGRQTTAFTLSDLRLCSKYGTDACRRTSTGILACRSPTATARRCAS